MRLRVFCLFVYGRAIANIAAQSQRLNGDRDVEMSNVIIVRCLRAECVVPLLQSDALGCDRRLLLLDYCAE